MAVEEPWALSEDIEMTVIAAIVVAAVLYLIYL